MEPIILRGAAAAVLVILSSCGTAAPATRQAGAECAWTALSGDQREALLSAYARQGSDGLGTVQIDDAAIRSIGATCKAKADPDHLRAVSVAIAGAAMRHGAEHKLRQENVQVDKLDQVWRTAAQTPVLLSLVASNDHSPASAKELFTTIAALTRLSGGEVPEGPDATSDPRFKSYADYFVGRGLEERAAASFEE